MGPSQRRWASSGNSSVKPHYPSSLSSRLRHAITIWLAIVPPWLGTVSKGHQDIVMNTRSMSP